MALALTLTYLQGAAKNVKKPASNKKLSLKNFEECLKCLIISISK